jgi:8-oxo-dGTP diphosphatase
VFLEQLYTFGAPRRDPRTRVISVAYYALVDRARFDALRAAGDVRVARLSVPWEGETGGPVAAMDADGSALALAFDHAEILGMAVKRLRGKLDYTPIGFQLLPERFTLLELQRVHETVLGRPLNKDSFRRRMLASGLLEATGEAQKDVDHRPAELYRFVKRSAT